MEKKSKLVPILIGIIVLLLVVIGILLILFKDAIFNETSSNKEEETKEENDPIDWKTEYYNTLKNREKEEEEVAYALLTLEEKETPILVVAIREDTKITYDFYQANTKIEKIGSDTFDTNNKLEAITKKGNQYYLIVLKANNEEDLESITINDIKIKRNKITFETKEEIKKEEIEEDLNTILEDKYGQYIELKEIDDYEYIEDVKKENDSSTKEEIKSESSSFIEYGKKYKADGTGEFDEGIYFIFYEDGNLEYSENMCEGYYHLEGTYKIQDNKIKVNIPDALNEGKWTIKIISKDRLKFDETYDPKDYVCGYAYGFILEK